MSNPSFADIKSRFTAVKEQIGNERSKIIELVSQTSNTGIELKQELRDLKQEEKKYDQDFREQQAIINSRGGKTREQTLQEFVLVFFYVGFALLSVSLATYVSIQNSGGSGKVIGIMAFIGLLITGIIIRYAWRLWRNSSFPSSSKKTAHRL